MAEEARIAQKRRFTEFLDGNGQYVDKIRDMMSAKDFRLIVDVNDLRTFDADLFRRLVSAPSDLIQPFEEALADVVRNQNPKYLTERTEVKVGFTGSFGFNRLSPRQLLSPFLGKLVQLEGIVTKCSLVHPKVVTSVHYCPATNEFMTREYRDATSSSGLPTTSVYPTKDANGNLLNTEYGLCKYRDHQTISIQEMPENAPPGQLPRSVDILLEDDLVDVCKPGDRVSIVGVYKAVPPSASAAVSGVFRTCVIGTAVRQLRREASDESFSPADIRAFKEIAKKSPKTVYELLGRSLAPSICGHEEIKQALCLLLLGGLEKNLANGGHLRGDINCLMVGDPSVAKSQLLRAVMNVAPLAICTTGRGSSGVGLTAAVTNDSETGERRLEAGAMVLADRGVVLIDEFDKMGEADRVAIHEVMEQQTVTIAKAGIHASLNARCSVLAAANPLYGTYDPGISMARNVALPDSLLSRFDLLFVVLDHKNARFDREISSHVLRMHAYRGPGDDGRLAVDVQQDLDAAFDDEEGDGTSSAAAAIYSKGRGRKEAPPLSVPFLKKYIAYAKNRPVTQALTDEAMEHIAEEYAQMRAAALEKGSSLPITARTLETMIRLSTAHAKMRLAKEVVKADAEAALRVMKFALNVEELIAADKKAGKGAEEEEQEEAAEAAAPRAKRRRADPDAEAAAAAEAAEAAALEPQGPQEATQAQTDAFDAIMTRLLANTEAGEIAMSQLRTALKQDGATKTLQAAQVDVLLDRMMVANRIMVQDGTIFKI